MTNRRHQSVSVPLAVAFLTMSIHSAARGDETDGQALVQVNCARCHAIGLADTSAHLAAPAFRSLSERYPIEWLEEALAEGISTGHPDMPEFIATPEQIDAILGYIRSLTQP